MPKRTEHDNLSADYVAGYKKGAEDARAEILGRFSGPVGTTARAVDAVGALASLLDGSFAHIRLTPEADGKQVHCKLAVRTERWPKHYVYYLSSPWATPADFLPCLRNKADSFWSGEIRPSPDVYGG